MFIYTIFSPNSLKHPEMLYGGPVRSGEFSVHTAEYQARVCTPASCELALGIAQASESPMTIDHRWVNITTYLQKAPEYKLQPRLKLFPHMIMG